MRTCSARALTLNPSPSPIAQTLALTLTLTLTLALALTLIRHDPIFIELKAASTPAVSSVITVVDLHALVGWVAGWQKWCEF